jgi:hypothetical protein
MAQERIDVIGGVDTHKDSHVAAVIDYQGRILDTKAFRVTEGGYRALLEWMRSFGELAKVGMEGTGAYGAGLARRFSSTSPIPGAFLTAPNSAPCETLPASPWKPRPRPSGAMPPAFRP